MVQQVVECESTRFVNLEVSDRSNNPEVEFEVENTSLVASPHDTKFNISNDNLEEIFTPISYHMLPTPQFLNMDEAINCVISDWTPWEKPTLGNVETMTSIIYLGGHASEDSNRDDCRIGIVDIIRVATDVMCIIRENYRLPHVEHGGGRSPAQSTVARPPLV